MSQVGLHNKFLSDLVINSDLPHSQTDMFIGFEIQNGVFTVSKVRFGFEGKIKFVLERIHMWGNKLVDGELIFREESTIEHHRVMVEHLVQ